MDKIFLDANVLFSAAYREKNGLLTLWQSPKITLVTSEYALDEANRNLPDPIQRKRLNHLMRQVTCIFVWDVSLLPANLTLNSKDRPILAAAITAQANFLITGDKDFQALFGKTVSGVNILTPSAYFALTAR